VIRALVLGDVEPGDVFRVIFKEFRVGLLLGVGVALLAFLRVILFNRDMILALMVSLSLLATVVLAKLVGCILPLLATKLKLDPARMASPMIGTLVDALALFLYFTIALRFFPGLH